MKELKGLATGIGSLAHKDAQQALNLIFKSVPEIPFWPQLPKRDVREGMVAQFSENLPCLKMARDGLFFDPVDKDKELERFYEHIIANDVYHFKISADFAQGLYKFSERLRKEDLENVKFIKCQITGPFTFAASIKDEKGMALLHDSVFMQAIIKGLTMKALWQIKFFQEFGKKIIVFIDEPYLGCFGSAYTPINREDVVKGLAELTEQITKSGNVLTGVHCCGNTDWSMFTDIKAVDIISFDAYGFLDKFILYADNLKDFLSQNKTICWGIVPTQEFSVTLTADLLLEKLKAAIEALVKKGLDRQVVVDNLFISPACGLGSLGEESSKKIFKLLSETSVLIREQLVI